MTLRLPFLALRQLVLSALQPLNQCQPGLKLVGTTIIPFFEYLLHTSTFLRLSLLLFCDTPSLRRGPGRSQSSQADASHSPPQWTLIPSMPVPKCCLNISLGYSDPISVSQIPPRLRMLGRFACSRRLLVVSTNGPGGKQ